MKSAGDCAKPMKKARRLRCSLIFCSVAEIVLSRASSCEEVRDCRIGTFGRETRAACLGCCSARLAERCHIRLWAFIPDSVLRSVSRVMKWRAWVGKPVFSLSDFVRCRVTANMSAVAALSHSATGWDRA